MRTRDKMWCSHCVEVIEVREECGGKFVSCSLCGKLLDCAEFKRLRVFGKLKRSQGLWGRARNLFDIDDHEVARYLHNGKERCLEKIIWEEMHNLYLQLKAAKEAEVAAAAKGTGQASLDNGFEELISAKELAKWTAVALGKSRKEKMYKHPTNNKSSTSTKSRYHELKRKDNTKKQRTTSEAGERESDELKGVEETHKESEAAAVNNAEDQDLINADADHYEDAIADRCNNKDSDCYGNGEGRL